MRIGIGYDVHAFCQNRQLILGGVNIPYDKGLLGHSDADVLVHAIMDSILGALGQGDIGKHFPDTDPKYKDISSLLLLKNVYSTMEDMGYKIGNLDTVIMAEEPKIAPHIEEMKDRIGEILHTDIESINIKATTTEELGFVGRKEGIAAKSVCLLKQIR